MLLSKLSLSFNQVLAGAFGLDGFFGFMDLMAWKLSEELQFKTIALIRKITVQNYHSVLLPVFSSCAERAI